ncbi:MAG: sulfate ABC transporter permease subunit CysT [Bacilli bacterium]
MKMFTRKHSIPGFKVTIGFTTLYMFIMIVVPISLIYFMALGDFTAFWKTITSPQVVASYYLSFSASLAAALTNVVVGTMIAWVLVRYEFPFKKVLDSFIDLPFALPTAVAGISLTTLYANNGLIGSILPFDVAYTQVGIYLCLVFVGFPYVVRMVQPVLESFDQEAEEAAASLGATRWQVIRRVIFPDVFPAILTGFALSFARAIGEYGSVVFIAGNIPFKTEITPLIIMTKLEQFDYAGASSVAVVMLTVSFLILLSINLLERYSSRWNKTNN